MLCRTCDAKTSEECKGCYDFCFYHPAPEPPVKDSTVRLTPYTEWDGGDGWKCECGAEGITWSAIYCWQCGHKIDRTKE